MVACLQCISYFTSLQLKIGFRGAQSCGRNIYLHIVFRMLYLYLLCMIEMTGEAGRIGVTWRMVMWMGMLYNVIKYVSK